MSYFTKSIETWHNNGYPWFLGKGAYHYPLTEEEEKAADEQYMEWDRKCREINPNIDKLDWGHTMAVLDFANGMTEVVMEGHRIVKGIFISLAMHKYGYKEITWDMVRSWGSDKPESCQEVMA